MLFEIRLVVVDRPLYSSFANVRVGHISFLSQLDGLNVVGHPYDSVVEEYIVQSILIFGLAGNTKRL